MTMNCSISGQSKSWLRAGLALAACAAFLAGCTAEEIELENRYTPYAGSDRYPIKVAHGKAHVKECGSWEDDSTYSPTNEHLANHGCAVQSNIAAMLADPDDLNHPNRRTLLMGDRARQAVDRSSMPVEVSTSDAAGDAASTAQTN